MKKKLLMFCGILHAVSLLAQHPNIVIDNTGSPDEPSIAMDINNPARMVAGTNISNVYYSKDTGKTWTKILQKSTYGVWGDPVIACDTEGAFYHFHLSNPREGSWIDRIVCQKSTDGGMTWSNGSYTGLNGKKNQDKHWVAIDRKTNAIYCTWTQFDLYESRNPQDSSHIMFSKSVDGGLTWTPAKRINERGGDCLDDDDTTEGAVPTVGANGEIYVTWAGPAGLVFDRSKDGGNTWLSHDIKVADIGGGWTYDVPGIYRCNGLPITVCDTSKSAHRGTIYVNWSDQKNGENNTDVWLVKSTDGGNSWSIPQKVNDDKTNRHQFMTWMTVDQANGNLWFVYYDRRNYLTDSTDVYMACSTDGGKTFQNFKVSQTPFLPNKNVFFGDYTHVIAHNNIVRPIWTAMTPNGKKTIFTALVNTQPYIITKNLQTDSICGTVLKKTKITSFCYYKTSNRLNTIRLNLRKTATLKINLINAAGATIVTVAPQKSFPKGVNEIPIDIQNLNLPTGVYTFQVENKRGKKWATCRLEMF